MLLPKPWYRKSKKAWYLQVARGEQMCLGKTKADADRRYREWLIDNAGSLPQPMQRHLTIAELAQEFLNHSQKHTKPNTYIYYCFFVVPFVERFGSAVAETFLPRTFNKWLDEHTGWNGSRRGAIISIKRMFNFAVDEGLLVANPLKKIKKPPVGHRERILEPEEKKEIRAAIRDEAFREFVLAMQETGARPMEVATVMAADVDLECGLWTLQNHKTASQTGKPRVIYLSPAVLELTKKLMLKNPEGPLFRSPRGNRPFTHKGIRSRFRRLRKKLPHLKGVVAYTYRHSFATDALALGVPVATVAELLSHKDLKMVQEHYGHLSQKVGHLQEAVRTITDCA